MFKALLHYFVGIKFPSFSPDTGPYSSTVLNLCSGRTFLILSLTSHRFYARTEIILSIGPLETADWLEEKSLKITTDSPAKVKNSSYPRPCTSCLSFFFFFILCQSTCRTYRDVLLFHIFISLCVLVPCSFVILVKLSTCMCLFFFFPLNNWIVLKGFSERRICDPEKRGGMNILKYADE